MSPKQIQEMMIAKVRAEKLAQEQECDREPGGDYDTPCDEEAFSDSCRDED